VNTLDPRLRDWPAFLRNKSHEIGEVIERDDPDLDLPHDFAPWAPGVVKLGRIGSGLQCAMCGETFCDEKLRIAYQTGRSPDQRFALGRPPLIRLLFIIQVPDASDKRGVALALRPINRFSLRFEGAEVRGPHGLQRHSRQCGSPQGGPWGAVQRKRSPCSSLHVVFVGEMRIHEA
jgi:hypothetical protein